DAGRKSRCHSTRLPRWQLAPHPEKDWAGHRLLVLQSAESHYRSCPSTPRLRACLTKIRCGKPTSRPWKNRVRRLRARWLRLCRESEPALRESRDDPDRTERQTSRRGLGRSGSRLSESTETARRCRLSKSFWLLTWPDR